MVSPHSLLSTKDCDEILHNCLKRDNLKVASYTVKSLSDKIEGFLGEHFFVTIEYEDKEGTTKSQRCFMKVLNGTSKLIFEISESLNAYNKEKFLYTYLLNEFEKYHIDTSFAPNGYFCKPHLLVLEDLSERNFIGYANRSQFLDLDHCKIGLTTLAKFHASGLLYEAAKSAEQETPYCLTQKYPEMFEDVLFTNNEANLANQWFKKSLEAVFDLISAIAENYNVDKDKFKKLLSQALRDNENFVCYLSNFKGTILHGDVWFNNFMFKYEDNIPKESILLDYQLLKYGPPSVDVLHFIYANTRKILRDAHFDELIEFYYKELNSFFPKADVHLYVRKDQYLQLCSELKFMLKLSCICDRSVTLLVDESNEIVTNDDDLRIMLFQRRSERIIECFKNNAFFKEIMAEDMVELYNLLLIKS